MLINPEPEYTQHFRNDILIIDDNWYNMMAVISLLKGFNLEADAATSGEEGMDLVKKRLTSNMTTYKLIMMDYSMPVLNGAQTTLLIRQILTNQAPDLPQPFVCCLTSYAERNYRYEAFKAGMDGFLNKPVFKTGLKRLLTKAQVMKK